MKEAFGGIFNIIFIVIFLVIAIGVLGLTFSYTKAFKMKNAIISTIEQYEGNINNVDCQKKIKESAAGLAYSPVSDCKGLGTGFNKSPDGYYCYKFTKGLDRDTGVYTIVTQTDIHFPIMEKITGFSIFKASGDTKTIKIRRDY